MLMVTRHTTVDPEGLLAAAAPALRALSAQAGCLSAEAFRALDDPQLVLIVTRWQDVGSYRRALSSYEVKVAAVPVLSSADNAASAFEVRLIAEGGELRKLEGDRADDADRVGPS
jgi:quinol monooxygenase YgiN